MHAIFVSYRRQDSAGHAGRLFDSLVARFGDERVFMDVSDLKPGQDFVEALERALDNTDALLAVIGPDWLTARDAEGRRRLDDPDDLVCREVAAGLARKVLVVPVLVRGASMPQASGLPPALKDLARRQAVELRDDRWNAGLDALVQVLEQQPGLVALPAKPVSPAVPRPTAAGSAAKPRTQHGFHPRWTAAAAGALALAVAVGWWALRPQQPPATGPEVGSTQTAALPQPNVGGAQAPPAASGPTRYAIPVPSPGEVRLRAAGDGESVYRVLAIRQEPWGSDHQYLTFRVRLTNHKAMADNFWSSSFRLLAGGAALAPVSSLNKVVATAAADEGEVRFRVPAGVVDTELEISNGGKTLRMPVSLARRQPIRADAGSDEFGLPQRPRMVDRLGPLPLALPAGQEAALEAARFEVLGVEVERESAERAAVVATVRCTAQPGTPDVNFWSDSLRLIADGIPFAPENSVNEVVAAGASKAARFTFVLRDMPGALELEFRDRGASTRVPLQLPAVARR